jgi:hypothetical protein
MVNLPNWKEFASARHRRLSWRPVTILNAAASPLGDLSMSPTAEILQRYGIVNRSSPTVCPVKPDMWRVSVNDVAIDLGGALKLSKELEDIGEHAFAWHVVEAINSARRNQAQNL